jgi:hypothetical protein
MSKDKSVKRISFLAKNFNVFTNEDYETLNKDEENIPIVSNPYDTIDEDTVLGLYKVKRYDNGDMKIDDNGNPIVKWVGVHEDVFIDMVQVDPTVNKIYVQWMLQTFSRYIKSGDIIKAIRFATEDLPQAEQYLILFDSNKYKQAFARMCKGNEAFKNIDDPSNINQYKNLSQLFDAVDPYIERDVSQLEKSMQGAVRRGEATIPFKDRKFTVFCPLTKEAASLFHRFTTWCTAVVGQSNFSYYVNHLTPYGKNSKLFVIIDHDFFYPEDDERHAKDGLWQLHVETSQLMDKRDVRAKDFNTRVLDKSEGLTEYFYDVLVDLARGDSYNVNDNVYVKQLLDFGFTDILFEVMNPDVMEITFKDKQIRSLPDMSKFKYLKMLYLNRVGLESMHESLFHLPELEFISIPNNKMKTLPLGICYSNKLIAINLAGNKINELPNEIRRLDRENGGNLIRLVLDSNTSSDVKAKAKKLLPTTDIVEFEK